MRRRNHAKCIRRNVLTSQNYGLKDERKMSDVTIAIRYSERDTMPDLLKSKADELDITVEQLVKRFICSGMQEYDTNSGPAILGETLEDFFVKNGVLKER